MLMPCHHNIISIYAMQLPIVIIAPDHLRVREVAAGLVLAKWLIRAGVPRRDLACTGALAGAGGDECDGTWHGGCGPLSLQVHGRAARLRPVPRRLASLKQMCL